MCVAPTPQPQYSTTQLVYATEMNSFTLGIQKYLKGFKMMVSSLPERRYALFFFFFFVENNFGKILALLSSLFFPLSFWLLHFLICGC